MAATERDNRRSTERAARHGKIVDAALRTFSRHGYRGATTRQLARAAGVTEVTLFRHFASKERLFGAVLDKYSVLPVLRAEQAEAVRDSSAREAFGRIGRRLMEVLHERQDLVRLMFSEAVTNPRTARMLFRQGPGRFLEDAEKMLAGLQRRGEIRPVDLKVAARAVLGLFFSFMLLQEIVFGRAGERLDPARAAEELSEILWRGLRSDRPVRKGGKQA